MLDALNLPILQPKPPILILKLHLLIIRLRIGLFNDSIDLIHIIRCVFLVLIHPKQVGLLSYISIDLLIEPFEQFKCVIVALNLLDQPSVGDYFLQGL